MSIVRPTYTVSIVMIDTVILCGNSGHDKDHFQPTGPENSFMADDQLIYIESALKNASKYVSIANITKCHIWLYLYIQICFFPDPTIFLSWGIFQSILLPSMAPLNVSSIN